MFPFVCLDQLQMKETINQLLLPKNMNKIKLCYNFARSLNVALLTRPKRSLGAKH